MSVCQNTDTRRVNQAGLQRYVAEQLYLCGLDLCKFSSDFGKQRHL